jgi:hypothetical protein
MATFFVFSCYDVDFVPFKAKHYGAECVFMGPILGTISVMILH